jgi:hypothetical protein
MPPRVRDAAPWVGSRRWPQAAGNAPTEKAGHGVATSSDARPPTCQPHDSPRPGVTTDHGLKRKGTQVECAARLSLSPPNSARNR